MTVHVTTLDTSSLPPGPYTLAAPVAAPSKLPLSPADTQSHQSAQTDLELKAIVEAWPALPRHLQRAILEIAGGASLPNSLDVSASRR